MTLDPVSGKVELVNIKRLTDVCLHIKQATIDHVIGIATSGSPVHCTCKLVDYAFFSI